MMSIRTLQFPVVLALAAALGATPALAQGKGKQKKDEKQRTEQVRQLREDRRADDRWEDRRDDRRSDRWEDEVRLQRREGGPPFCRNGKGHPVHGRRWCVEKGFGLGPDRYDDRRYEDRRYDDRRYEDRRSDDYGRYGSYEDAHRAFHREHDRICRERAAQRPFDVRWQLQVRGECKAEHDRWHAQAGRRH